MLIVVLKRHEPGVNRKSQYGRTHCGQCALPKAIWNLVPAVPGSVSYSYLVQGERVSQEVRQ